MNIINQYTNNYEQIFTLIFNNGIESIKNELIKYIEKINKNIIANRDIKRFIYHSNRSRTITTLIGSITFKRAYFYDKLNKNYITLLDANIGIQKYEKIDSFVKKEIIKLLSKTLSYKDIGQNISRHIIISPTTICRLLKDFKIDYKIIESKNNIEKLYIEIDEKYISYDYKKEKELNCKKRIFVATIFENIDKTNKNRHKLVNRHIFNDMSNTDLKKRVYQYVTTRYKNLKQIYIYGDGAKYIANYVELFGNIAIYIPDKFHLFRSYYKIFKEKFDMKNIIEDNNFNILINKIKSLSILYKENKRKHKQIRSLIFQLKKHREKLKLWSCSDYLGCSIEGIISHYISPKLSYYPARFKKVNLSQILKLKEYTYNKDNTVEYQFSLIPKNVDFIEYHEIVHNYISYQINSNIPSFNQKQSGLNVLLKNLIYPK